MESLALLVALLMLAMFISSMVAAFIAWRADTRKARLIASVLGLPGGLIGVFMLVSVGSTGARVFGLLGFSGFAYAVWRTATVLPQLPPED